jgi:adenosylcobyric acid synthase
MGQRVTGYEIHHGVTTRGTGAAGWVHLDDVHGAEDDGAVDPDARALGTSLHGLYEEDGFRAAFLTEVGRRRGKTFVPAGVSFAAARDAQFDRLADLIEANLDLDAVLG